MPHLSLQISAIGPVLDLYIAVSVPRAEALRKHARGTPNPIAVRGLVDTGASCTCVDPTVLQALGVVCTGTTTIHTPSTKCGTPHVAKQFDVSIILPHPMLNRTFTALPVIESELLHQGIQVLLGRDILAICLLTYDGQGQTFCLGF